MQYNYNNIGMLAMLICMSIYVIGCSVTIN